MMLLKYTGTRDLFMYDKPTLTPGCSVEVPDSMTAGYLAGPFEVASEEVDTTTVTTTTGGGDSGPGTEKDDSEGAEGARSQDTSAVEPASVVRGAVEALDVDTRGVESQQRGGEATLEVSNQ